MPTSSTVWWAPVSRSPLASTCRPSRPWRASRSSMWSRKPTPVAALAFPPSRSSASRIWVSAVLRSLRLPFWSSVLIIADSPWTGKPSARARASTCGASFAAAPRPGPPRWRSGGGRRRARAGRRSDRRRRSAARGWSRRRSRRRRWRCGGRRRRSRRSVTCSASSAASSSSSSRCSGAKALARSIASLRSGTWTRASGASPMPCRSAAAALGRRRDGVQHGLLDRDGDQRALGSVLGLGAEVERRPLGVGVVPGDEHQLRRARRGSRSRPSP